MSWIVNLFKQILYSLGILKRAELRPDEILAGPDQFLTFRDLAYRKLNEEIHSGNPQGAIEWSRVVVEMELSLKRLSEQENKEEQSVANPEPKWKQWWESIDEIIFLYIAFAIGFLTEVIGNQFQPIMLLVIGALVLLSVLVYVWWKWNRFLVPS